jgi:hypothetical protein
MGRAVVMAKGLYGRAKGAGSNATNREDFLTYRPRQGACKWMTPKAIDLLGVTRKQSGTQRVQVGEQPAPSVFRSNIRIGTNKVTQGVYLGIPCFVPVS